MKVVTPYIEKIFIVYTIKTDKFFSFLCARTFSIGVLHLPLYVKLYYHSINWKFIYHPFISNIYSLHHQWSI